MGVLDSAVLKYLKTIPTADWLLNTLDRPQAQALIDIVKKLKPKDYKANLF